MNVVVHLPGVRGRCRHMLTGERKSFLKAFWIPYIDKNHAFNLFWTAMILYMESHGNCAQIVPDKVKYFQKFPNKTKNTKKIYNEFNMLKLLDFQLLHIQGLKSLEVNPCTSSILVPGTTHSLVVSTA